MRSVRRKLKFYLRGTSEGAHDADNVHLVHVVVEDNPGLHHQYRVEHGNQNTDNSVRT